ncbi:uncharacterized protein LOC123876999 [Maniola jurtina]|uniref:uncharacterized protein LOC123876999 n=1 Tax=Maniola jurtina TaxID=191418 RepID=UPI001E68C31E|nr:uncharacterized protein LOC123876999 [Maniola jurtina]
MLRLVLLTALTALAGGMETRETVQRLVMVRTTGSDLQPAATGYIYKKDDDGPESVVHMAEGEVMEHLAKLYTRPAHAASDDKAHTNERVIPVKEPHGESVDGIADVDYKKIFDDYSAAYGHDRAYDDYLKNLKRFKGGLYSKYDADRAEDDKGSKHHKHGKGDAKSYHNEKFESYSISGGHKKDQDDGDAHNAHKKHYDHYGGFKNDEQDAARGEHGARSFHGVYDDDKHDHQYFGKGGKAFADEHKYYGTGDRAHKYHSYEPEHYAAKVEHGEHQGNKSAEQADSRSSDESTVSDETTGDARPPAGRTGDSSYVGPQDGQADGSSYGYEVKH